MQINDLLKAIANGELDQHQDAINQAFRSRRQLTASITAQTLVLKQLVRLSNLTPAWLNGRTGKIVGLPRTGNSKRFDVELDETPIGCYHRHTPATKMQRGIPAVCITPIE